MHLSTTYVLLNPSLRLTALDDNNIQCTEPNKQTRIIIRKERCKKVVLSLIERSFLRNKRKK